MAFKSFMPSTEDIDLASYKVNQSNVEIHCCRLFMSKPSPYECARTLFELPPGVSGLIENVHNVVTKYPGVWYDNIVTEPMWEIKTVAFVLTRKQKNET